MDPEAARTARQSLDLTLQMANNLDTGLDRHTLSVLIDLCDMGLNPEASAAVVKELRREASDSSQPRLLHHLFHNRTNGAIKRSFEVQTLNQAAAGSKRLDAGQLKVWLHVIK